VAVAREAGRPGVRAAPHPRSDRRAVSRTRPEPGRGSARRASPSRRGPQPAPQSRHTPTTCSAATPSQLRQSTPASPAAPRCRREVAARRPHSTPPRRIRALDHVARFPAEAVGHVEHPRRANAMPTSSALSCITGRRLADRGYAARNRPHEEAAVEHAAECRRGLLPSLGVVPPRMFKDASRRCHAPNPRGGVDMLRSACKHVCTWERHMVLRRAPRSALRTRVTWRV
jgi:hypothetical protein